MENPEHPHAKIRKILERKGVSEADLGEWSRVLSIYNNSICEDKDLQELLQIFARQTDPEIAQTDAALTEYFIGDYLQVRDTLKGYFPKGFGKELYRLVTKKRLTISEASMVLDGYKQAVLLPESYRGLYIEVYRTILAEKLDSRNSEGRQRTIETAKMIALNAVHMYADITVEYE